MEHPVIALMRHRRDIGSKPGDRDEPNMLGLVIEGGGMRGIVSAGMLSALHHLSFTSCFDCIYGSSAGAINASYYIADQAAFGTTIYYDNIANSNFISLPRLFFSKRPVMSLDYLLDVVMTYEKPLDWYAVINANIPISILATNAQSGMTDVFRDFGDRNDLFLALRASANIPLIAGPPTVYKGNKYFDASLSQSIPLSAALGDGCTHVLALLTRPQHALDYNVGFFEKYFVTSHLKKYGKDIASNVSRRKQRYRLDNEALEISQDDPTSNPSLLPIRPPEDAPVVGRLEKNRNLLLQGARLGMRSVYQLFDAPLWQVIEVLCPYNEQGHFAT